MGLQLNRVLNRGKRVIVSDEIKGFPFLLQLNSRQHRPEIVPNVQRTSRLQPCEITDHWQDLARILATARGSSRLRFGVWRLAFGVWRLAFGVWRFKPRDANS